MLKNNYFWFFVILFISVALGELVSFIFKSYLKGLTQKTKNNYDDIIVNAFSGSLHFIVWGAGLYLALRMLNFNKQQGMLINRIFLLLLISLAAYLISKTSKAFISSILKSKSKIDKTPKVLSKLIAIIVYIIAGLMILTVLGVEITPLIATFGVGGLAIGLALQSTLSNLFSGIYLVSDRPITIGNYVKIGEDIEGYVEDIGWRTTKIKTIQNNFIIVPNTKIAESTIVNNSYNSDEQSVLLQCGVGYSSDLEKVEKITIEVATQIQKTVKGAVRDFKPFIRFHTFGDSNINFTIILRVESFSDKYVVKHEMIKALKKRFDEENIEISWPIRKIISESKIKANIINN